MKDRLGREIEYLRISVTQNCNLKCIYCKPEDNEPGASAKSGYPCSCTATLTSSEFSMIVKAFAGLGIRKVRITGGEPLTRPDILSIVEQIAAIPSIEDLSMTTNGIALDKMAEKLKKAGLMRLNISLDSLKEDRFHNITGGRLEDTLSGIQKALDIGFPVRINTVLIKGINDDEVNEFILLTKDKPVDVRFIELMPIGKFGEEHAEKVVCNNDIINTHPELIPCDTGIDSLPARYYCVSGYRGRVGFISPVSHKFCSDCNRIRLTCDGKIKPCLGSNGEIDILSILRDSPDKLEDFIKKAIYEKPEGHNFNKDFVSSRSMNKIGG